MTIAPNSIGTKGHFPLRSLRTLKPQSNHKSHLSSELVPRFMACMRVLKRTGKHQGV